MSGTQKVSGATRRWSYPKWCRLQFLHLIRCFGDWTHLLKSFQTKNPIHKYQSIFVQQSYRVCFLWYASPCRIYIFSFIWPSQDFLLLESLLYMTSVKAEDWHIKTLSLKRKIWDLQPLKERLGSPIKKALNILSKLIFREVFEHSIIKPNIVIKGVPYQSSVIWNFFVHFFLERDDFFIVRHEIIKLKYFGTFFSLCYCTL